MSVNPVILVHGTQGSWLKDEYPVDYNNDVLWTGILKKKFDTLHLHELDATVDAQVKRWIMPHQAVPLIYEGIVDEIRDEMDEQPYAYVFTYDWRKDNRLAAQALSEFIDRVLRVAGVHEKKVGRSAPRQVVLTRPQHGWIGDQMVCNTDCFSQENRQNHYHRHSLSREPQGSGSSPSRCQKPLRLRKQEIDATRIQNIARGLSTSPDME